MSRSGSSRAGGPREGTPRTELDAARVSIEAPAKVNLFLSVRGRREDGFHEIETVFQAVSLFDSIEVERSSDGVRLEVVGADVGPTSENLVWRAAQAYLMASGVPSGVSIRLVKRIPAGAGLGGGSSDAGHTLKALDLLFEGAVAASRLEGIAAELGSDVPFFLGPHPTAVGVGRGDELRPLPGLDERAALIVSPDFSVGTADAYRWLAESRSTARSAIPLELDDSEVADWGFWAERGRNDFEEVLMGRYPALGPALNALRDDEAILVMVSGSGSALFGVYRNEAAALRASDRVERRLPNCRSFLARTLSAMPAPTLEVSA